MVANNTSPINTSAVLVKDEGTTTPYFKRFLDTLWRRTGGFTDALETLNNISSLSYVVQTASVFLTDENVATDTGRIAWDFSAAGQAKLDLIAASVVYAYLQNVSASDRILGRQSVGAGIIEEIICTAAGRALIDDANAAAQLTTLGISAYIQTLLDDADASTAQTTLGISTFVKTLLDDADASTARGTLGAMAATTTLDAIPIAVASVDFGSQQAKNFRFENRTSDPGSPAVGQVWLRTDL